MSEMIVRCPSCDVKNRIPLSKSNLQPKCGRCGQKLSVSRNGIVNELDDAGFDRVVIKSSLPAMVDFYSPTCGPCQVLAPVIETLAKKYTGRVLVAKLDTSRFQVTAGRYGIRGVPTLIFFKNGKVVDQLVGAAPQDQIEQKLNALL
jgi:thioredoxin 2